MEKLACNECGAEYTDEGSIGMAKSSQLTWAESCKEGGIEMTGIAPCPSLTCKGQLVLTNECNSCDKVLTGILAQNTYSIRYDEEQKKWVKECGEATYVCSNCLEELDSRDIEDILRQVDEL